MKHESTPSSFAWFSTFGTSLAPKGILLVQAHTGPRLTDTSQEALPIFHLHEVSDNVHDDATEVIDIHPLMEPLGRATVPAFY